MPTLGSNTTRLIGQNAQYIQEKWTRDIQQPFDKELQAAPLVQDRSGEVADGGDILNIPFAAGLNARAKAASTAITYDSADGTPVVLNIDKHYYVGMLIEDILKVQSSYDVKAAYQQRMVEALARQVDTDLMSLYTGAGTVVSAGATVDDADMLAVVAAFDTNNVPSDARRGIIGHNSKTDLLGINKYTAYDQTGKTGKAVDGSDGLVGQVYDLSIYHSGNVITATTGHNLFFHKRAINLAKQQAPKTEMEYSVDYLGWKVAMHTIYGVGVERASAVIDLTRTTAP